MMTQNSVTDKWQLILSTIPSTLKSHFTGSTAEVGDNGLIIFLPNPQANIEAIKRQIAPTYLRPKIDELFGAIPIDYQLSLPSMPEPQERIRIVDKRKPRYFQVDNRLFDNGHAAILKPSGLSIYLCLCRHADYDSNDCYPSYATIAKKCGLTRATVINHIKRLASLGYIEIKHNFDSNGDNASNTFFILELPEKS